MILYINNFCSPVCISRTSLKTFAVVCVFYLIEASINNHCLLFQNTYDAAMMAAGSSVELVDQIVSGQLKHGMAIVRWVDRS